jgi:hypothetical protein
MTPEQMRREEEHGQLMAVAHSLTDAERTAFLGKVTRTYPQLNGADVADVLELTADYDMFLDRTESFFERFEAQMPDGVHYAPRFAAHVIILLGRELTPGRVWSFLQRAGVVGPPRYPEVEVGLWVSIARRGGDGNHLLVKARAEQGMRVAGVPEHEITEFRSSLRATGIPGYGQNMADIAKWVTLVDCFTEMPRKFYDPTDDLAVVLAADAASTGNVRQPSGEYAQALANLRSHLDMRAPETIKSSLLTAYGREV